MRASLRGYRAVWLRIHRLRGSIWLRFLLRLNAVDVVGPAKGRGWPFIANYGTLRIGSGLMLASGVLGNPVGGSGRVIIVVRPGASLTLGENVRISNAEIYCAKNIQIGSNVLIGGGAKIYDTDFHSICWQERRASPDTMVKSGHVVIGDDVFVGGGAMVLKNVSIGPRSVIGALSVVTKSIPPDQVWAGNPACFVKEIG